MTQPSTMPDPLDRIRRIFDRAPIALTLADMSAEDAPLVVANPVFCRMTGYDPAEVLGRNCRFLQAGPGNGDACTAVRRAMALGHEAQVILENRRKDGTIFDNLLFLHPVGGVAGKPRYFLGSQFALRPALWSPDATDRHSHHLAATLTRIAGIATEAVEVERRRHLAEASAMLVRAWLRRN